MHIEKNISTTLTPPGLNPSAGALKSRGSGLGQTPNLYPHKFQFLFSVINWIHELRFPSADERNAGE